MSKENNVLVPLDFSVDYGRKLTTPTDDKKHYTLNPQRGCFERCERCFDLAEADSYSKDGVWYWKEECMFCIRRAIDMLGYYEHGIVPEVTRAATEKSHKRSDVNDIYAMLSEACENSKFKSESDNPSDFTG